MPKILENPKESILSYAKEIVLTQGIENLTMREVSKKSGIAVGTIYNYFPTKSILTIELIENYWYEYLNIVDDIDKNFDDLFIKLQEIFKQMNFFVDTFKEIWIKNYSSEYTDDGLNRKNVFLDKLYKKLEKILIKEQDKKTIHLSIDPYIIAKFLILNFMMMAQMNQFEYEDFDKIIKDYLSK
ncbi:MULTISPECIES: TetR/AcrR family transcriptional regulator [Clostridium]|uniref:TetR/AcrR family transcriptional regulator n=1 Tax=Clostridium cibarium TaxID=2762247 RepID=A0ABR8PUK5_9CLOT|nr:MULTISPECIES: TetR/AcrR family transcriptional regulator [Clostridium]MBD7911849.1 TetR/AcrR family transcriptional regulator [Clostridium cibarium]